MSLSSCIHDTFGLLDETVDWQVAESEHFIYHYQPDYPDQYMFLYSVLLFDGTVFRANEHTAGDCVQTYLNEYEKWYLALSELFGYQFSEKIDIYSYHSSAQSELVGNGTASSWSDYKKANGEGWAIHHYNTGVDSHELVHVFASKLGPANLVLQEGLAVAVAAASRVQDPDEPDISMSTNQPSIALPSFSNPQIPANDWEVGDHYYVFPIHRASALIMGLESNDPEYQPTSDQLFPDIRPSQINSWVNVITKNDYLPYIIGGSWVYYLIENYGWTRFMRLYKNTSPSPFSGTDNRTLFREIYDQSIEKIEADWIYYLQSQPVEHWSAPVYLIY